MKDIIVPLGKNRTKVMACHFERKMCNFEVTCEIFATTVQICLLESSNNCPHMGEKFLCCFNDRDIGRKYFLWRMHFIVTINEKRKVKLTWLALSKVCVYVFVYSGFMTSQIAKPHFKDQITRHLENKADRKYPKQPQEVHASITSFSFLRYNIVKLHLDLRLTYFEEKKKTMAKFYSNDSCQGCEDILQKFKIGLLV